MRAARLGPGLSGPRAVGVRAPYAAMPERIRDWVDDSLASSPWRAHTAVDVNLPTLNDFRIMESRHLLGAAARRVGLS